MQEMKQKIEELESFKECNAIMKIELEKTRDIVKNKRVITKMLVNDALKTVNINKTLTMPVEEKRKTIIDLKVRLESFKSMKVARNKH